MSINRLIIIAYVFLLLGYVGSLIAYASPFWFTNAKRKNFNSGIFTIMIDKEFRITSVWMLILILPITITSIVGLVLGLASVVLSSVQICCFMKSRGYKLCKACGSLGLVSSVAFTCSLVTIFIVSDFGKQSGHKINWALILSIISTAFLTLASIIYLVAGHKLKSNSSDI